MAVNANPVRVIVTVYLQRTKPNTEVNPRLGVSEGGVCACVRAWKRSSHLSVVHGRVNKPRDRRKAGIFASRRQSYDMIANDKQDG